jgi:hypothetical protein
LSSSVISPSPSFWQRSIRVIISTIVVELMLLIIPSRNQLLRHSPRSILVASRLALPNESVRRVPEKFELPPACVGRDRGRVADRRPGTALMQRRD